MLKKFGLSGIAFALLSVLLLLSIATVVLGIPTGELNLWLKSDAGVTLSGSSVSSWANQAGSASDAEQASAGNQPTLVSSAINGLPATNFDGTDDFLTFTLPINDLTGMTIFLVSAASQDVEPPFPYCQNAAIFWNESGSWGTVHVTPLQRTVWIRFGTGQTQTLPVKFDLPDAKVNEFTITTAMMEGVNDYLYIDGELVLENTKPHGELGNHRDTGNIGRGYNDDTYFPGMIAEVLVYTRTLSDAERQEVEAYLNSKYFEPPTAVNPSGKLAASWAEIKVSP